MDSTPQWDQSRSTQVQLLSPSGDISALLEDVLEDPRHSIVALDVSQLSSRLKKEGETFVLEESTLGALKKMVDEDTEVLLLTEDSIESAKKYLSPEYGLAFALGSAEWDPAHIYAMFTDWGPNQSLNLAQLTKKLMLLLILHHRHFAFDLSLIGGPIELHEVDHWVTYRQYLSSENRDQFKEFKIYKVGKDPNEPKDQPNKKQFEVNFCPVLAMREFMVRKLFPNEPGKPITDETGQSAVTSTVYFTDQLFFTLPPDLTPVKKGFVKQAPGAPPPDAPKFIPVPLTSEQSVELVKSVLEEAVIPPKSIDKVITNTDFSTADGSLSGSFNIYASKDKVQAVDYFIEKTLRGRERNKIFVVDPNSENIWKFYEHYRSKDSFSLKAYWHQTDPNHSYNELENKIKSLGEAEATRKLRWTSQKQVTSMPSLRFVDALDPRSTKFDALIVILSSLKDESFPGKELVLKYQKVDNSVGSSVTFHHTKLVPGNRLIISPLGKTDRDTDDVRCWSEAAKAGIARAQRAGSVAPILYLPSLTEVKSNASVDMALHVTVLAAYQQLYRDLQARENFGTKETFVYSKKAPKYVPKNIDEKTAKSAQGQKKQEEAASTPAPALDASTPAPAAEAKESGLDASKSAAPSASAEQKEAEKPAQPEKKEKPKQLITPKLGFMSPSLSKNLNQGFAIAELLTAIEAGKILGRDLGGPDPERMAPPRFAEHVKEAFASLHADTTYSIISDEETLAKEYPLLHSVARASFRVKRHAPSVVRLEYTGEGPIQETLLFAGKGVTYDTGGADIKTDGIMAGMSRDKCGASYVAGFLLTASLLRPKNIKIIAELGLVRNSIGSDAYVADEVIKAHSGQFVKILNTDAEGRLVMADCLSHLRQHVKDNNLPNAKFMTMATLTGHAIRAVGPYTVLLDNGPAKKANVAADLQRVGEAWGDPFEISTYRREDFETVSRNGLVFQTATGRAGIRGHQVAATFLNLASGLGDHGLDSQQPFAFTYIDIAPSACEKMDFANGKPTSCCIAALTGRYLIPRLPSANTASPASEVTSP